MLFLLFSFWRAEICDINWTKIKIRGSLLVFWWKMVVFLYSLAISKIEDFSTRLNWNSSSAKLKSLPRKIGILPPRNWNSSSAKMILFSTSLHAKTKKNLNAPKMPLKTKIPFKSTFLVILPGALKLIITEKHEDPLLTSLSPTKLLSEMYDFMSLNPRGEVTDELVVRMQHELPPNALLHQHIFFQLFSSLN